jgi:hypothetical protein
VRAAPQSGQRWSKDWALVALAAVQRSTLSLAAHMDGIYSRVQPHAEAFRDACKLDPATVANFGEVCISQNLFQCSHAPV